MIVSCLPYKCRDIEVRQQETLRTFHLIKGKSSNNTFEACSFVKREIIQFHPCDCKMRWEITLFWNYFYFSEYLHYSCF